jgi:hypothetical protein
LIKTSIITAPHSLPLTFGFWRKTDSAASAITGMTFRLFPAAFTKRLESYGRPCDNPTVLYLMAILAKRDAVRWLISQSRIIAPFLDVVGVYRSRCAALLTGKIVTLKNSGTPLFIFIAAMLFRIRNLRCFVSTGRAAMLRFWMPSPLLITLFRAVDIWRIGYFGNKISSTNRASFSPAGVTAQTGWLATCERLTTLVAYIHGLIISFMQRMSTPFCILQRMTDAFPGIEIKRIKKA